MYRIHHLRRISYFSVSQCANWSAREPPVYAPLRACMCECVAVSLWVMYCRHTIPKVRFVAGHGALYESKEY